MVREYVESVRYESKMFMEERICRRPSLKFRIKVVIVKMVKMVKIMNCHV